MLKKWVGIAGLVLVLSPVAAYADWLITPMFGSTFGADTHGRKHAIFGGAVGVLDADAFGWEGEVLYAPAFFEGEGDDFVFTDSSSVLTGMVNALISMPLGDPDGASFRPYFTGGIGAVRIKVVSEDRLFTSTTLEAAYNVGAGAIAFVNDSVGVRGDVRYIRSFQDQPPSWTRGIEFDVAPGNFDFFRATIGITFRFGE